MKKKIGLGLLLVVLFIAASYAQRYWIDPYTQNCDRDLTELMRQHEAEAYKAHVKLLDDTIKLQKEVIKNQDETIKMLNRITSQHR